MERKNYIERTCKRVHERVVSAKTLEVLLRNSVLLEKTPIMKDGEVWYQVKVRRYSPIAYENIVNGLVRDRYSESTEFAILRKAINYPSNAEYVEYNAYVEECKSLAKAYIDERTALFGK